MKGFQWISEVQNSRQRAVTNSTSLFQSHLAVKACQLHGYNGVLTTAKFSLSGLYTWI